MWTLVYNGQEKVLGQGGWGIAADFEREAASKQKGVFRCRTVEGFDAGGPQFAYRGAMTVWRDRTAIGSGGTVYFQGFWDDGRQCIEGSRQWIEYAAYDVWWLFERQIFMQQRRQLSGTEGHISTGEYLYNMVLTPEVYLGELLATWGELLYQTNGEQVVEVVDWMNETYNPTKRTATSGRDNSQDVVQAGTIDPSSLIPVERASGLYCSEAITRVLRLNPDVVVWIDSTTTPPSLNVRTFGKWNYGTHPPTFIDYTNLTNVTVNITADQESRVAMQMKHAAQLAGVAIYYRTSSTIDGVTAPFIVTDNFPTGITDYTPEVSRHLIELEGAKLTHVRAQVQCNDACPPSLLLGSADYKKAWFLGHDKTLNDPKVNPATIVVQSVSIVDDTGAAVDLGLYPNELMPGCSLPKWIGARVIRATVMAELGFSKYADAGHVIPNVKADNHVVRQTIRLTDAVTRTYEAVKFYDPGETVPVGVAEMAYRSVAALQSAAQVTFTKGQLRSDIQLGCRLTLVGPNTTFSNILVQSIHERPHYGETTINGHPQAAVDADTLMALARASRWRTTYNMPSGRDTGGLGPNGLEVDTSADGASENTAHGVGGERFSGVIFQHS